MHFVDVDTALSSSGLRLLVAASVPSPWSQAALAIVRWKKLPMVAARTRALDPAFAQWKGARNLPAVLFDDEPVRTGWSEILALAERLAPDAPLLPNSAEERAIVTGLCHELMSEGGILWSARLLTIDAGLSTEGREGFPLRVAQYLAPRYGWAKSSVAPARARAVEGLALLDHELSRSSGPYYRGETLTAVDIYSAVALNAMVPLSEAECPIAEPYRAAFTWMGATLGNAITERLKAHRDRVVARCFSLPIEL